jgi:ketosteroid isomerase-like protein
VGVSAAADKVSVAQAVVDGFAARDQERLLALFRPDAEFATRVDVTGQTRFQGHEGVRAWLEAVDERFERYELVDCEYRSGAADRVFVTCRLRLQFAGDRYGMARLAYWVFRVDEAAGRVRSFTSFRDRHEAEAAAGL